MTRPRRDVVVAAGAAVCLGRLVRLHRPHVDAVVVDELVIGHSSRLPEERPGDQRADHDDRDRNDDHVAPVLDTLPERVEAHGDTVPA